ncbi:MAG: phosphotransferase family protein [Alphaproteobacteria bacterium]|nr:phosphotransferase family protein [Alphaproteobacteria bacterium]
MKSIEDELRSALHEAAIEHFGDGTEIEGLVKLSGGASRETWSFDAAIPDGGRLPLILKRDPPSDEVTDGPTGVASVLGVDRWTEGRLLELAGEVGVPVPRVHFFLAADPRTTAGFVMQRLEGETLGRRILREDAYAEARPKLAFQCGQAAARLHGIPIDRLPPLNSLRVDEELQLYRDILDSFEHAHAGFEYALHWLEERQALAGDGHTLAHGDYRNGNFVVGPDGLRAVLDWELGHLGNPFSDLGWICIKSWRYGHVGKPVGGFGEVDELLAGYQAGGGAPFTVENLRFWEVFGCMRWGVVCVINAFSFLTGSQRTIETATIGRRAAETEYDLLELLD